MIATLYGLVLIALLFPSILNAQKSKPTQNGEEENGRVRSIALERSYIVKNGRQVVEDRQPITLTAYDEMGRVVEEFVYGEGYARTRYRYSADRRSAEIAFFDNHGAVLPNPSSFKASFDWVDEVGLCAEYSVRSEFDPQAKVSRTYEVCADRSTRATTVDELDEKGAVIRSTRNDALGRSWIHVCEFARDGGIRESRVTVNNGSKSYTTTTVYADHRYDHCGNWVRMTASSFHSSKPGELVYQFNEIRSISYYSCPNQSEQK